MRNFVGKKLKTLTQIFAAIISCTVASGGEYLREIKPILSQHCYRCHGASQQKGGLRVDTAALLKKGGETGPGFLPGKTAESLIIQALKGTHDSISQMPYKKPPLTDEQVALIEKWISEGAIFPTDEAPQSDVHWSFVPPKRPVVPVVGGSGNNAIDAFIRNRLRDEGLSPSPAADRVTLLRRLSLDLTGLPPTPAEVDAFLADETEGAFASQVERLLQSVHYGERWGRWWLDVARYADSNGYSIDAPRQIWKYRDWVVSAFNQDMPFDQFAVDQLAGDLVPNATVEQKVATGFNRNTQINQEGGIDPEQFRVESVVDRVNTFGTAFLGLTVGCAQCHDHKFDAISHKEYYQLYAYFNQTGEDGHGKGTPGGVLEIPGEYENSDGLQQEIKESSADLERYLNTKGSEVTTWAAGLTPEQLEAMNSATREALKLDWSGLTPRQKRLVYAAFNPEEKEFKSRETKLVKLEKREPKPVTTLVMVEAKEPRDTHIFIKGDFTRPSEKVSPGVLAALHKPEAREHSTRLDLARWVVDKRNPLLARVTVNRIWQQYFGKGLVETENDFGTQGSPPTYPELLDWLACEFMEPSLPGVKPWSIKHIHRMIVSSATYQQSSKIRPDLEQRDANNKLLARQNRLRLDAEIVRDVALTASGVLSRKIGGPPVYPPQPAGVMNLGQSSRAWKVSTGEDRYRRAMYTHFWRATAHPALTVFDAPDAFSACTRRLRSNTPLQALTLLNDQQFYELAQALAKRVESTGASDEEKVKNAFRLCLARNPSEAELHRLTQLLANERELGTSESIRWETLARVLLNLDETITRE